MFHDALVSFAERRVINMKKNKAYFTTGEFAKIVGIKKQTLFHYDQCGIFCPDIIENNGYRYYSYTQLETFAIIAMLRELNVPIKDIKEHMDHRSPENLISLLESKKIEIENKIHQLNWSKNYIDDKIKATRQGIKAVVGEVVLENIPDEYMITTDYRGADDEKAVAEAVGEHFSFCHQLGLYSAYPIGAVIPVDSVSKDGYKYSKFYTVVHLQEMDCDTSVKPVLDKGGNCLAIYDNRGYTNIHSNCLKLLDYGRMHNLSLGDCFYEDVLLDDLSTNGYYNYLVKLSIMVN